MTQDIPQNPAKIQHCLIPETLHGTRLDKALAILLEDTTRNQVQHWIENGQIRIASVPCTNSARKVRAGEMIEVQIPEPQPMELTPWDMPLDILYEDHDLLVMNKPAGMVVHPGAGHWEQTLVHALLAHCGDTLSGIGGALRPGIIHRLDKDTSGLMLVAKHDISHRHLAEQLASRTLSRQYITIAWGVPAPPSGIIDAPIARHPHQRKKMAIRKDGKPARTLYTLQTPLIEGICSLVTCVLETGRTHQIRVHMTHKGYPLVGDPTYGNRRKAPSTLPHAIQSALNQFPRQALHAETIRFIHPGSRKTMQFQCALPEDIQTLLDMITP